MHDERGDVRHRGHVAELKQRVAELPVSRRVTASVGRHCIASTKNTSAAAAVAGVNTSDPSLRVIA